MFFQVQYPLFDGRPLQASPSILPFPVWPRSDIAGQYVRRFGKIVSRRRKGVEGLPNETLFCQLHNSLKAGDDWNRPFPALSPQGDLTSGMRDHPRFVVRRLFFDGLYSGKLDLGFFLPSHRFTDDVGTPDSNARTFEGILAGITSMLGRGVRFRHNSRPVGRLGKEMASEFARATAPDGADSSLVRLGRPTLYADFVTDRVSVWGPVPGWQYTPFGFGELYQCTVSFRGREMPLFVTRTDRDQIKNRGRHLRIAALRFCSEISNIQTLLSCVASGALSFPDNAASRPLVHAHMKATLKFLRAAGQQAHLVAARDVIGKSAENEYLEAVVGTLSELDSYWEATKRRELWEIVMGDKVGGDKVGGDKVTAGAGGVAVGRQSQVSGGIKTTGTETTHYDMNALATELERVSQEMKARASGSVEKIDADLVREAASAASQGEESNVIALLKKVGGGLLGTAKDIGAKIVVEYVTHRLGI